MAKPSAPRMRSVSGISAFKRRFEAARSTLSATPYTHQLMDQLHSLVGGETGAGHLLLFPLTTSAHDYEFVRGALGVLAPKAKTTLLVTPQSTGRKLPLSDSEERHLAAQARRLLVRMPTLPSFIHVVDMRDRGKTLGWIESAFRQVGYKNWIHSPYHSDVQHQVNAILEGVGRVRGLGKPLVDPPLTPWKNIASNRLGWLKNSDGSGAQNLTGKRIGAVSSELFEQYMGVAPDEAAIRYIRWARTYHRQMGVALAREYLKSQRVRFV